MILSQFRQGHPIPIPPFPDGLAVRCRVTGRSGYRLRVSVLNVLTQSILAMYTFSPIPDPFDCQFFTASDYYTVLAEGEGIYLLKIDVEVVATNEIVEQLALQFVCADSVHVQDITQLPDKCEVFIADKDTGLSMIYQAPLTTARIAFYKFVTTLYKFDPQKKLAFMRTYYGAEPSITDLGWYTRAIITIDYRYESEERLLAHLTNTSVRHTTIPNDVYDLISRTDVTNSQKIQTLLPYAQIGIQHELQGRVLGLRVASSPQPVLSCDVYYRAGFLGIDWNRLLGYIAIGAVVAGAVAISVASFGVGVPIGWAMVVGAMAGASAYFLTSESPSVPPTEEEKSKVVEKAQSGKKDVDTVTDQAKSTVDTLVGEGKVTADAGERIKGEIERIRVTSKTVIDELVDESKRQIDEAYKKGRNEGMLFGGVVGGVGGLLVGAVITR